MKDPAFLFYSSDFLTGTMFMTNDQVGMFIRLLCAQHQKGRLSEKHMLNICSAYDEDVFNKFKKDSKGNYYNERLEYESNRRKKFSESRRNNAKGKRKSTVKTKKAYAKHMENENENRNEDIIDNDKLPFQLFWDSYDKKIGSKSKCESKWNKLSYDIQNDILNHLDNYIPSTPDKKYRVNPETYFNQERWNNEIINNDGQKINKKGITDEQFRETLIRQFD